jgi:rhamnogalacturonan endolyase
MYLRILLSIVLFCLTIVPLSAQEQRQPLQISTRPPEGNDSMLRELTPEEIPPNLNFYAIDPLYNPNAVLGWADERIEEKLDRGLLVLPAGVTKVYLSWRLLKSDPKDIAFNIYRMTDGGKSIKLNIKPQKKTTDFLDSNAPLKKHNSWWINPVLNGLELQATEKRSLEPNSPILQYKTLRLKDNIQSVDRIAVADLNGDGCYDFVVKHPRGSVDPGRNRPSRDSYKIDGYDGKTGKFLWRFSYGCARSGWR